MYLLLDEKTTEIDHLLLNKSMFFLVLFGKNKEGSSMTGYCIFFSIKPVFLCSVCHSVKMKPNSSVLITLSCSKQRPNKVSRRLSKAALWVGRI